MKTHKLDPYKEMCNTHAQNRWERAVRRLDFCRGRISHCVNAMRYSSDKDFWSRQIEYYSAEVQKIRAEFPNHKL